MGVQGVQVTVLQSPWPGSNRAGEINPLWLDEASTLSFATDPSSMASDPSHPPGY